MVPLISSIAFGPLGVCQLPRLWWKVLLRHAGLLDTEYPDCSGGLDAQVLDVLHLDREATLAYLRSEMPTYLHFEDWVREQNDGNVPADDIARWNESVRTRVHTRPEKIAETYRDIGLAEGAGITSAVLLNCLQDWQLFHGRDLDTDFAGVGGRMVPLVSTLDYGPLGVCQLPRTWLKNVLHSRGRLHPDYPHMTQDGLDARALRVLNVPPNDAVEFLHRRVPTYLEFEAWTVERTDNAIDDVRVQEWNAYLRSRIHTAHRRAEICTALGHRFGEPPTSAVVLNHVEDWHYAHADLIRALH
jgi:hypothetical protein